MYGSKTVIIIPARLNSSRFPNKPLVYVENIPMVIRVYQQALKSNLGDVFVAGCDKGVEDVVKGHGYNYIETRSDLPSGTDRAFYCYKQLPQNYYNNIINLQCDMPYVKPESIRKVSQLSLINQGDHSRISTAAIKINNPSHINSRDQVKVIISLNNEALYFTRSAVAQPQNFKHIGIYGFTPQSIKQFALLKQSPLEKFERLEQLRALENNMKIDVVTVEDPGISIDTKKDLERIDR